MTSSRFPSLAFPIILDNTVIGRYGLTGQFDVLKKLYGKQIVVPVNVVGEALGKPPLATLIQTALNEGWLEEYALSLSNNPAEFKEYIHLRKRFDDGEAAVMAMAKTWRCTVASDDMRATRNYCTKNGISQIGSLGIMYHACKTGVLVPSDCDLIIANCLALHQKMPIASYREVEDWFDKGVGKELF